MTPQKYPKTYLYRCIVQAKLYMDTNYSECIDLNNISDEAYFSKFHFIRHFKKIYGKTPHQYLAWVRIEAAKRLLQADVSVSEVCGAVGFESLSSFSGRFKKMVGMTPSIYVSHHQMRKQQTLLTPLKFVPGCFADKYGWMQKSNFGEAV